MSPLALAAVTMLIGACNQATRHVTTTIDQPACVITTARRTVVTTVRITFPRGLQIRHYGNHDNMRVMCK